MSKIPLVGPSSQQSALAYNAERTINMYAIADQDGKNPAMLVGLPGLELFAAVGNSQGRGCFTAAASGRLFVVNGSTLYEVLADGTSSARGSLSTSSGVVVMEENGVQLMISDGQYGYTFAYSTNSFAKITAAAFPSPAGSPTFLGGYFVVPQLGTGKFYTSDLYNGAAWQALNFATAESSPDILLRCLAVGGQLWLFGSLTTEVWTPSGNIRFPFELITGGVVDMGIAGPHCVQGMSDGPVWVGRNREGGIAVYRANGFTPVRISTEAIERLLKTATNFDTLRTWRYQEEGHSFLIITGGGMKTSLIYDTTTKLWFERASLDAYGEYAPHRGADCTVAFGKTLVIDKDNGNIYRMALDIYSENGEIMPAERIFTHIAEENKNLFFKRLVADLQVGVGTANGQGIDPKITLSMSNDGSYTWFGEQTVSIGGIGQYQQKVEFWQLGMASTRTFKLRITDPVKRAFLGLYLDVG